MHVLVRAGASCCAFGALAVHAWPCISGESNLTGLPSSAARKSVPGQSSHRLYWDISGSTETSEKAFTISGLLHVINQSFLTCHKGKQCTIENTDVQFTFRHLHIIWKFNTCIY